MPKPWWANFALGRTPVSNPLSADDRPDGPSENEWRALMKQRVLIMLGILAVWAVSIQAQLVHLQVFSHERFAKAAASQQLKKMPIEALRGDILDRNGRLLATSIQVFELRADPSLVKEPAAEAKELCQALTDCGPDEAAAITAKLARKTSDAGKAIKDVLIRNSANMSPNAALGAQRLIDARAAAKPKRSPAFSLLPSGTHRYYPKMDLAGQVIGFVSPDGNSSAGVERRQNDALKGEDGVSIALVDARGGEMFASVETEPRPGSSVELTIDGTIQHIAETTLRARVEEVGALGGAAVVLAAGTGEILADASYQRFNPNVYGAASGDQIRNAVVQNVYEPGSTLKIVTASAALNEHVLTPETIIDTNPGSIKIRGRARPITEDRGHNYSVLSFEDVLVRSSNVGAVMTGLMVGPDRMLQYAKRFPFGQRIAPDFGAAEETGRVSQPGGLSVSSLASVSMGYEVMVTPLQMAAAASIIANGGALIEPHLVRATIADGRRREIQPKVVRQVVTPETAATMTAIMEDVVVRGTGVPAALERFRVAGKTGTAKKVVNGRYSDADYYVSFVGFVPSRHPRFVILVLIDRPRKVPAYGGSVAGPAFKRIADLTLQYDGTRPSINPPPPVVVASDRRSLIAPPARPAALTPVRLDSGGRRVTPDLRGLTLREALREANAAGLSMSSDGDGVVVFQSPAPGDPFDPGAHGVLQLRREPARPGGGDR